MKKSTPLLVTACDVGTANFLSPVLSRLPLELRVYAQPEAASIFKSLGIDCFEVQRTGWKDFIELGNTIFCQENFSVAVTGTSWGPTLDKAITLAARSAGKTCVAIVEHWSLYRERFSKVAEGKIITRDQFLPDQIWLNDTKALQEACGAGLPKELLRSFGQPHLERLYSRFENYKDLQRDDCVVFFSERLREDFMAGSPLDPGFDEYLALESLLGVVPSSKKVIVKLHPQEKADKYDYLLQRKRGLEIVSCVPIEELIAKSGRIVGMLSMALLEAALLRDDVISFLPGGKAQDFVGNRIGATRCVTSASDLAAELAEPPASTFSADFGARFVGSTDRVIEAIVQLTCV